MLHFFARKWHLPILSPFFINPILLDKNTTQTLMRSKLFFFFFGEATHNHGFQNRTGPGGWTVKTGNRDENRFFKPKEPDFLLIP